MLNRVAASQTSVHLLLALSLVDVTGCCSSVFQGTVLCPDSLNVLDEITDTVEGAVRNLSAESQNWRTTLRVTETKLEGLASNATGEAAAHAKDILGLVKGIIADTQALTRENVNCGADIIAEAARFGLKNALVELQNSVNYQGRADRPHEVPRPKVCFVDPASVKLADRSQEQLFLSGANFSVFGAEKPTVIIRREGPIDETVDPTLVSVTTDYRLQIDIPELIQSNQLDSNARQIIVEWRGRQVNPNEIPIDTTTFPEPLVADFSAAPRSGFAPLTVQFTDKSTGNPNNLYWDFGNGETSTNEAPSTTYNRPGYYDVELLVFAGDHRDLERKVNHIEVKGALDALGCPIAALEERPGNHTEGKLDGGGKYTLRSGGSVFFRHVEDKRQLTVCAAGDVRIQGNIQDQTRVTIYALGSITVEGFLQGQTSVALHSRGTIFIGQQIKEDANVVLCTLSGVGVAGGVHDNARVFLDARGGRNAVVIHNHSHHAIVTYKPCTNL